MWVNLTASVSSLSIVPVYSQISVLSSGALPFAAGTLATGLYAFVQNTGNGTGRFTLVPTGCSGAGNPVVTAGSITQTLLPGATVQFIFPVGGPYLVLISLHWYLLLGVLEILVSRTLCVDDSEHYIQRCVSNCRLQRTPWLMV